MGHTNSVLDACREVGHEGPVAITIHDAKDIEGMRRAGQCAASTLAMVGERLEPGVRTADIDRWVREDTARRGARPSQLGFHGFPAAVCVSPNEVVCHGIPREDRVLREGDIVNVDVTSELDGYHGDCSITFEIGQVSAEAHKLVETTRQCRDEAIAAAGPGVRLGALGQLCQDIAQRAGFRVLPEFGGHGIGRNMHMYPHVPHVGPPGRGIRLREGMTITIEPILTIGRPGIETQDDGWTVVTRDHSWSAQFEHTILITSHGAERLTLPP